MSSSQDPDTADPRPVYLVYGTRPDGNNIGCRPVFMIYGLPIALYFIGTLIACVGLHYTRRLHPWEAVEDFFILLFASAIIGIPGLLVVIRHPWASLGLKLPLRHPRLGGLVQAWIGLIFFIGMLLTGASLFISIPFLETRNGVLVTLIALLLCIGIPILALALFDRRR